MSMDYNRLSVGSTHTLLYLGNWSERDIVSNADIKDVSQLPDVQDDEDDEDGYYDQVTQFTSFSVVYFFF